MQDNIAKSVKTFFSGDFNVMGWLSQRPDMNPIEKLLNEKAKEKNPINVEELWTNLNGEWQKIPIDQCKT